MAVVDRPPQRDEVIVNRANQTAVNFTACAVTYAISGTITLAARAAGASVALLAATTFIAARSRAAACTRR